MTAREFFKSTAFKCIAVLLAIVLICGIVLTFCNALLEVPDEERTARAVAKVFPGETVTYEENDVKEKYADTDNYTVEQAFTMTGTHEGQYLLNIVGKGGYKSGTVTCWILVDAVSGTPAAPGLFTGISKVVITGNEKQSFMSKVSGWFSWMRSSAKPATLFRLAKSSLRTSICRSGRLCMSVRRTASAFCLRHEPMMTR